MSLLSVQNIAKSYGPVVALRSVDMDVEPGSVHALLGANGAGKSTLVKILTGVIRADRGEILLAGNPLIVSSPVDARRKRLCPVFQDPALVPDLTVRQNLRMTRVDAGKVQTTLRQMDLDIDPDELVANVPLAMLRMIDLARAMTYDPQVLLLDEITAALPSDLAERVFVVARELRDRGGAVVFVSHRLAEITMLCDRATILRDGEAVGTLDSTKGAEDRIVELMLGESHEQLSGEVKQAVPETTVDSSTPPALAVTGLQLTSEHTEGVGFDVRAGEIVGVASLEAQGQDELFEMLSGMSRVRDGRIERDGKPVKFRDPYDAIRHGIVLVPADRVMALLPDRPIRENIAAPLYASMKRWGVFNRRGERARVDDAVTRLQVDTRASAARRLSGGNQQKLTIARWVATGFEVLLCFDPTRGIDVGTKRQIYALLRELAAQGSAVLLFTSELAEISLVCDRVIVLHQGRISDQLVGAEATEARLLRSAHGLVETEAVS
ncbi:MAG: sugar ABC transporter ATP-binding protein [Solirubrobacteraceae bacterium]